MELKIQSLLLKGNHTLSKFLHAHGWSTQILASLVERKSPSPNLHTALTGGARRIDCSRPEAEEWMENILMEPLTRPFRSVYGHEFHTSITPFDKIRPVESDRYRQLVPMKRPGI
ncbi:hypothetical protein TNCV_2094731 [Trichonephila clavipes]|nr:hypothetical protein TNCV_2094731 [Trichonephila clavipes]